MINRFVSIGSFSYMSIISICSVFYRTSIGHKPFADWISVSRNIQLPNFLPSHSTNGIKLGASINFIMPFNAIVRAFSGEFADTKSLLRAESYFNQFNCEVFFVMSLEVQLNTKNAYLITPPCIALRQNTVCSYCGIYRLRVVVRFQTFFLETLQVKVMIMKELIFMAKLLEN